MKNVSEQLEEEKKLLELAELQARPLVFTRNRLPIESVQKYGKEFLDVKDEDRAELEGILGIIDRSELLLCELPTSYSPVPPVPQVTAAPRPITVPATNTAESQSIVPAAHKDRPKRGKSVQSVRYRSPWKGHIRNYLTDEPEANDVAICGYLDTMCKKAIPSSWLKNGTRELMVAYRTDPETRAKVATAFSKVRRDLGLTKG